MALLLVIVAAFFKSLMDTLQFHFYEMRWNFDRQFWNPEISWENKYHMTVRYPRWFPNVVKRVWMRFWRWMFINPLVFLTDGWHLAQFIFLNSILIAIAVHQPIFGIVIYGGGLGLFVDFLVNAVLDFCAYRLVFGGVFYVMYNFIWIKNKLF